jgi:hypothetical protein
MIMNGILPTLLTQCLVMALIPSFNSLVTHYLAYCEAGESPRNVRDTSQTIENVNKKRSLPIIRYTQSTYLTSSRHDLIRNPQRHIVLISWMYRSSSEFVINSV